MFGRETICIDWCYWWGNGGGLIEGLKNGVVRGAQFVPFEVNWVQVLIWTLTYQFLRNYCKIGHCQICHHGFEFAHFHVWLKWVHLIWLGHPNCVGKIVCVWPIYYFRAKKVENCSPHWNCLKCGANQSLIAWQSILSLPLHNVITSLWALEKALCVALTWHQIEPRLIGTAR